MKTKFIAGLAMGAALFIGTPAFAKDHGEGKGNGKHKGKEHAEVASHPGKGHQNVAVVHHGNGGTTVSAKNRGNGKPEKVAVSRQRNVPASHVNTSNGNNGYHPSNSYHASNRNNYGNNNPGRYAFASHSGWNPGNEYNWNGNHYRWYNNGWFIVAPPVAYGYTAPAPAPVVYSRNSVSVQVQSALARQGYYRGAIDGIVGPGTRSAIAAYQHDNGLAVTGTINNGLLSNLGV